MDKSFCLHTISQQRNHLPLYVFPYMKKVKRSKAEIVVGLNVLWKEIVVEGMFLMKIVWEGARFINCNRLLPDLINYIMNSSIYGFFVIDYKMNVIDYNSDFYMKKFINFYLDAKAIIILWIWN